MRTFEKPQYAHSTIHCCADELIQFCFCPDETTQKQVLEAATAIMEAAQHLHDLSSEDYASLEPSQ